MKFLSSSMKAIDFAMLSSLSQDSAFASRPMSNNGDVDDHGDSYFFTDEQARTVADIERSPQVGLTFTGAPAPGGQPPVFIAVAGQAELIRDRSAFAAHWNPDLDYWFQQGIDTPGIVMIRVRAARIHYWAGGEQGEIVL